MGRDLPKVTLSGLSSTQLCPQGCSGLGSAFLCPRLCCGPGHTSSSASEGILQTVAAKLSARESAGSSWCSRVTAEPSEGTGAPPGAPQKPPPADPLLNGTICSLPFPAGSRQGGVECAWAGSSAYLPGWAVGRTRALSVAAPDPAPSSQNRKGEKLQGPGLSPV